MSQFLEIRDHVCHVAVAGPPGAPPVLLIHSLGASLELWEAQARALAAGCFVIRYDLRGHGLSSPPTGPLSLDDFAADAFAVLDALGVSSAHVAGISIGGMIAQLMAARAPERVQSLLLCDTALQFPPPQLWRDRAAQVKAEGLASVVDGIMERWVGAAYLASPAGRGLRNLFLRTSVDGYVAAVLSLADADLHATTRGLPHRTLVLVGEEDPSSPVAASRALAEVLPNSQLVIIPGARHVPLGEQAERVNAAFLAHLAHLAHLALPDDELGPRLAAATASRALDPEIQTFFESTARPRFDRRTRNTVTIALLAALGHEHELTLHVRAMKRAGATQEDLMEVLLQVAIYAGVPAANAAMRLVKLVFAEK